jgi:nitrite reductase/ring-hydroxylating ferredoxin subunit
VVTCPWHGLEFHVPTGQCVALPDIRLKTFAVRVADGEIRVTV